MIEPSLLAVLAVAATLNVFGDPPTTHATHLQDHVSVSLQVAPISSPVERPEKRGNSIPKWVKYGLLGGGAGAVLGLAIGDQWGSTTCTDVGFGCDRDGHPLEGALIGAGIGASMGALIGLREARRTPAP